MTILNEYRALVLCTIHNFRVICTILAPFYPRIARKSTRFLVPSQPFRAPFLCRMLKCTKIIGKTLYLVTVCSQLSYIIYMYIFVPEDSLFGKFIRYNAITML